MHRTCRLQLRIVNVDAIELLRIRILKIAEDPGIQRRRRKVIIHVMDIGIKNAACPYFNDRKDQRRLLSAAFDQQAIDNQPPQSRRHQNHMERMIAPGDDAAQETDRCGRGVEHQIQAPS